MVHVYIEGLEERLRRRLCSPRKTSSSWSGFEERSMIEVRAGSWAMAQLLTPVHRDGYGHRRSLRTSRKTCAHSVSSVKLHEESR